jgi:hypothetical protein
MWNFIKFIIWFENYAFMDNLCKKFKDLDLKIKGAIVGSIVYIGVFLLMLLAFYITSLVENAITLGISMFFMVISIFPFGPIYGDGVNNILLFVSELLFFALVGYVVGWIMVRRKKK